MGQRVWAVWAAALLLAGCQSQENGTKRDRERLQGTWGLVRMVVDGKELTDGEVKRAYRLTFAGDRYTIRIAGRTEATGNYQLDEGTHPKAVDITPTEGPDRGKTSLGIYQLDDGVLTVCAHDGQRPAQFFGEDSPTGLLIVLKREQP